MKSNKTLDIENFEYPKLSEVYINVLDFVGKNTENIWNITYTLVRNWDSNNAISAVDDWKWWFDIKVPIDWKLSFFQVLKLMPQFENYLWLNTENFFKHLAQILKITIAKTIKLFPKEKRQLFVKQIIDTAISDWIPDDFLNQIIQVKINDSVHTRNTIARFNNKIDNILWKSWNEGSADINPLDQFLKNSFWIKPDKEKQSKDFLHDLISTDLSYLFELMHFRRWKNLIYDYLKVFNDTERKAILDKYLDDPNFEINTHPTWEIDIYDKTSTLQVNHWAISLEEKFSKRLILRLVPVTELELNDLEKLLKDQFDVNYWNDVISRAPNEQIKNELILSAINALKKLLANFPRNDIIPSKWHNPADIAFSQNMKCVWKAIIASIFLEKLNIAHKGCLQNKHINLMVYVNNRSYVFDPQNTTAIQNFEIITNKNIGKTYIGKYKYKQESTLIYQLWEVEYMCMMAMLNNENNYHNQNNIEKLQDYQLSKPIIGFNSNMWENFYNIWKSNQSNDDLLKAKSHFEKEIKYFPLNYIAQYQLWVLYMNNWEYLKAYFHLIYAIKYWINNDNDYWNDVNVIVNLCREKLIPNRTLNILWNVQVEIDNILKKEEISYDDLIKILAYDPINKDILNKLFYKCTWNKSGLILAFLNFLHRKDKYIADTLSFEITDQFFKCVEHYHKGEFEKIFEIVVSFD